MAIESSKSTLSSVHSPQKFSFGCRVYKPTFSLKYLSGFNRVTPLTEVHVRSGLQSSSCIVFFRKNHAVFFRHKLHSFYNKYIGSCEPNETNGFVFIYPNKWNEWECIRIFIHVWNENIYFMKKKIFLFFILACPPII